MAEAETFRRLLIGGALVVVPLMLYHRIRAHAGGEPLDRRQEGLFILATLRPVALVFWAGTIAFMVRPASMAWSTVALHAPGRWTGVALFALGTALLAWALHGLGPNLTDTVVTRRAHTLVTTGAYRWVRHPFYDAMALIVIGSALLAANWFLLVTACLVVALVVYRTRIEEARLLARFGGPYAAYLSRTGRFLPRFGVTR